MSSKIIYLVTLASLITLSVSMGLNFGLKNQIQSSLNNNDQSTMNSIYFIDTLSIFLTLIAAGGIVANDGSSINLKTSLILFIPVITGFIAGSASSYYSYVYTDYKTQVYAIAGCFCAILLLSLILCHYLGLNEFHKWTIIGILITISLLFIPIGVLFYKIEDGVKDSTVATDDAKRGYKALYYMAMIGGALSVILLLIIGSRDENKCI